METQEILKQTRAESLTHFAWLSIIAAILSIGIKTGAYFLTGSVGLLSDAVESIVNLFAAVIVLLMLSVAATPADEEHEYGHGKAEYFASIIEGILIFIAALVIVWTAVERLFYPVPLEQIGLGVILCFFASFINFVVAQILMSAAKKHNSITLEADSKHLMTDVWTSVGVVLGVFIVFISGYSFLDPIIAILVGLNIFYVGFGLIKRSVAGLMDASLPEDEQKIIQEIITEYRNKGVEFHALRSRQAAARRFISIHVLVPGHWTVHDSHHIAEDFESDIRNKLPNSIINTHLEPIEDEISMRDINEQ